MPCCLAFLLCFTFNLTAAAADDDLTLRPIPGPEAPPPEAPWEAYVAVGMTGLVLVFAGFVVSVYLHSRRRPAAPLSPDAWALAELARIEKWAPTDEDTLRRQFESVANVLRRFLSLRFQLRAPEQTTEEFRQALGEQQVLSEENRAAVLDFLGRADLVKFARVAVEAEDVKAELAKVRQLITESRILANSAAKTN
jgi:hypothetical protein